ncbi:unnamed protein product [Amoebophrya sp. A120]|nr:unnamed protein product [Amoebophrya sp. A120]|eukprot:GSA120T00006590001.1
MTEVLWKWVQEYGGSDAKEEADLANGYKIGALLSKFNQQLEFPGRFRDTDLIDDQIANFTELQPNLKNLGIRFLPHDAEAIMSKKRGCALKLLYQIKMVIDRVAMTQRPSMPASQHSDSLIVKDPKMLARSFRLPKPSADAQESRFFVNRLRAQCAYATLQRREARYNRFEREKLSQQMLAAEMDKVDAEKALDDRETHRKVCLDIVERNRAFMDQWNEQGVMDWKANLSRQRHRERLEASYKQRLSTRRRQAVHHLRATKTQEVTQGIADFERNLRKFTSGEAESSSIPLDMQEATEQDYDDGRSEDDDESTGGGAALVQRTTKAFSAKDLMSSMSAQVPAPEVLLKDAKDFLARIKDSKVSGNLARKEREKRRRRFLVDLAKEHEMEEDTYLQEHLLQQLTKPCVEEERINYLVWKTSRYEAIMREDRRLRMKDYDAQRKRENEAEKTRDGELRDLQVEELFGSTQVNDAKWYRALERGRVARRRAYHVTLVENIVTDSMIELLNLANAQQELTDQRALDDRTWKNWMDSFINSEPLEDLYRKHQEPATRPYQAGPYDDSQKLDFESAELLEGSFESYLHGKDQWAVTGSSIFRANRLEDAKAPQGGADEEQVNNPWGRILTEEELEKLPEAYKLQLTPEPDVVSSRVTNFRVSTLLKEIITQLYPEPQQIIPPADPLPDVPLRIVLQGKPMAGKKTVARKLADEFGVEALECTEILQQAMNLAGRPQEGSLDSLHANAHAPRVDASANEYLMQLRECGVRAVQLLDEGEVIPPELYVRMIVCKLKSLEPTMKTGWVLSGFPATLEEMRLLEKALCGFIEPSQCEETEGAQRKLAVELLIPGPAKVPEPFVPQQGGYDLYLLLEASCEAVVLRSAGRRIDLTTRTVYNVADDQQKKPADIRYENLRALDLKEKAQGTFVERMHFFDVNQVETLDFLKLFAPLSEMPRLQVVGEDAPEHVFENVRERLQGLLEARTSAKEAVPETNQAPALEASSSGPPAGEEEEQAQAVDAVAVEAAPASSPEVDAAAAGQSEQDVAVPEPEAVSLLLPLEDVQKKCGQLEHRYLELLHGQWLEIQDPYVEKCKLALQKYEQLLRESAQGLSHLRESFVSFLEREKPEKQGLLNEYIVAYNSWNAEYPHMILDDKPRAEFHLRLQMMREKFASFREEKRVETQAFIEDIKTSGFVDGAVNTVCLASELLVAVETERYHLTSQLLCNVYALMQNRNIPEPRPLPEKIAIAKGTAEDEAEPFSARERSEDSATYEFSFLAKLEEYANKCCWPLEPMITEEDGPPTPLQLDEQQALVSERLVYLTKVEQIRSWARKQCEDLCAEESRMYTSFFELLTAREHKEGRVEAKVLQKLHTAIENCLPVENRLRFVDSTQVAGVINERIAPEAAPRVEKPRKSNVPLEWNSEEFNSNLGFFFSQYN